MAESQESVTTIRNADDAERSGQTRAAARAPAGANRVRRVTLIVLAIAVLLFVYHLVADRLTPYTSQAHFRAFAVDIAPEVAGPVVEVAVEDNQDVEAGQTLFRIDPVKFELAVRAAEAALDQAGQQIGASTAEVASAQAKVSAAEARLTNVREQTARVFELVRTGTYPRARGDEAKAQLKTAQEEVHRTRADLEAAEQRLGEKGANNPEIRAATAQLERAQLDLIHTRVLAPAVGKITNLKLSVGQFVSVGAPAMTFIDTGNVWMVAELHEKSLANVQRGDRAEFTLDILPGRVFPAQVESIGWGVAVDAGGTAGGLPTPKEDTSWVRSPQLFPVLLTSIPEMPLVGRLPAGAARLGSRASVVIYTGDHPVMNTLASIYIRAISWLGYVA